MTINVLMVTGAYHPEVNGAANQCRHLVCGLRNKIHFSVLTTTRDSSLPKQSQIDGIRVFRLLLHKRVVKNYCKAILKLTIFFLIRRKDFQIVHLHGFSLKSVLLTALSKIFRKKVIIKMTSIGHDDPIAMRRHGFMLNTFFSKAHVYVGTNPELKKLYQQSELPSSRYQQIPNGVDTARFRPVPNQEKLKLRNQLGIPERMKLILFVGHFSREKCPDLLLKAWVEALAKTLPESGIVFIGSTDPDHYEVDAELVKDIKKVAEPYINERIFFIERTHEIEKYYQASDIFVLPSKREGLPNALLEAMASGLPVIVSKLEGITNWVVTDEKKGLLFEPGNQAELGIALSRVLINEKLANSLAEKARENVIERFSISRVAYEYGELYRDLLAEMNKPNDVCLVSD
jgi:glycosyltransferase involved in cell wall biosynthesis